MSREVWFIFLMFGLKIPVIGIGYFLYRVLKAQDAAWENGGYGFDDGGNGGGGGGGTPRPTPTPRPGGGLARHRRVRPERPFGPARGPALGFPARRPQPAHTRVRIRTRP
jgi:hypothetical protein